MGSNDPRPIIKLLNVTSRVQGPCTDSHAKNPEGELAQNASHRGDVKRERAQHVNCVNNCERFLPEGPFLTPDPDDPKPDWQPPCVGVTHWEGF